jgi:hypothetical protein
VPYSVTNESELSVILNLLLFEISKNLSKGDSLLRREKIVIDCILKNEAFLPNSDILSIFIDERSKSDKNCLPKSLIHFWKDFLFLLQEKKILLSLFLQLIECIKYEKDTNKKLVASLWVKAIAQAFRKQKISRKVYQNLEQKFDHENKKLSIKPFLKLVQNEVETNYPDLKNVLNLNIISEFPNCLLKESFVKRIILNFTEFSEHFIPEIFKISSFLNCASDAKSKLLELIKINSLEINEDIDVERSKDVEFETTEESDMIYTVQNLKEIENRKDSSPNKTILKKNLADSRIRNTSWKIAPGELIKFIL